MRIATLLAAGLVLLLYSKTALCQQLKLGKNPYVVEKSAVLELGSDNQGLLLTRISDTTQINTLLPPDGMVIFFTPTKQLLIRSNGSWKTMAVGGFINSLNGLTASTQTFTTAATGTDFSITSTGSTHTFAIPDASASARGLVTTGAQTIAGAKSFSSTLAISATNPLTLTGVQLGTSTTADSLLTITNGLVRKLPMSTFTASGAALTSLNGLTASTQTFATGTTGTDFNIVSSGSTHTYNIPNASATARGVITAAAQTIAGAKSFSSTLAIAATNPLTLTGVQLGTSTTADSLLTITNGLVRKLPMSTFTASGAAITSLNGLTAATQTFATGTTGTDFNIVSSGSTHTYNIPDASATARGVVTTAAQTIAGAKSFSSTLAISATNPLTLTGVQTGTTTSADSVLTINNGTVKKLPVSTFSTGTGITSLNGLTTATQTFATAATGTDFSITSTGTAHTFSIPDASATARGVVTTAAQTFAGAKTFTSAPTFSTLTAGSIPFIGTGGLLSQNNANLFWDATNSRIGIGTNTPGSDLTLFQSTGTLSKGFRLTGNSIGGTGTGTGFTIALGYNVSGNKQLWLGDADGLGNSAATFIRYSTSAGSTILDAISGDNGVRRSTRIGVGGDGNSSLIFGDDNNSATPGSYVWTNGNMSIGNSYRSNIAPANGLIVQGNTGIGTSSPTSALHVVGTNPLTLLGVQVGGTTTSDSVLTINTGVVKKLPVSTFVNSSGFWAQGGNTVGSVKNFGTLDNFDLPFITNNTEKLRLTAAGSLGIGTSTFTTGAIEKLLVDQGTTGSINAIVARGTINNYMQLNIQNLSAGGGASSDVVATADNGSETTNFIDMGINSSGNNAAIFGSPNDAYLYNLGQNLLIGTGTAAKSLVFMTGGTTQSTNERMRIDGTGKVGIATISPTAQLDDAGTFKLGATGTVHKNQISYEVAFGSGQSVAGASLVILALSNAVGVYDFNAAIPAASQPSSTRASVSVSFDQDLPTGVSVAWARVSSVSNVKIRFINSNTATAAIPTGMKVWITINEF